MKIKRFNENLINDIEDLASEIVNFSREFFKDSNYRILPVARWSSNNSCTIDFYYNQNIIFDC